MASPAGKVMAGASAAAHGMHIHHLSSKDNLEKVVAKGGLGIVEELTRFPLTPSGLGIAGVCCIFSVILSAALVIEHLQNFRRPNVQRQTVRVLIMAPLYSVVSMMGIVWINGAVLMILLRDVYEAFCIFSFFSLFVAMLNGEREVIVHLSRLPQVTHMFPLNYVLPEWKMGGVFFYNAKYGVLQYVVVKPLCAMLEFLVVVGESPNSLTEAADALVIAATNVSQFVALYSLALLYVATREPLENWTPFGKFLSVKLVVFFTWWQGFFMYIFVEAGLIPGISRPGHHRGYTSDMVAHLLINYVVCLEMLVISLWHHVVFPVSQMTRPAEALVPPAADDDLSDGGDSGDDGHGVWHNARKVLSLRDVAVDLGSMAHQRGARGYGTFEEEKSRLERSYSTDLHSARDARDKLRSLDAVDAQRMASVEEGGSSADRESRDIARALARTRWKWAVHKVIERIGGKDTQEALRRGEKHSLVSKHS